MVAASHRTLTKGVPMPKLTRILPLLSLLLTLGLLAAAMLRPPPGSGCRMSVTGVKYHGNSVKRPWGFDREMSRFHNRRPAE
jgi:hypothetical protein